MDTRTGRVVDLTDEQIAERNKKSEFERYIRMKVPPTTEQLGRTPPKVGRNEPCPCGSGKKFKHCHLTKEAPNA